MKRSTFFESRNFALVIALVVVGVFVLLAETTAIPERLELRVLGLHFRLKQVFGATSDQEGVTQIERNPRISDDIWLIGVDAATLSRLGSWPFPRYQHADFIDRFTRVQNPNARENAVFLDFFFIEPSSNAFNDVLLRDAMRENGRVFLETVLDFSPPNPRDAPELFDRHDRLFENAGRIRNVSGPWQQMPTFFGLQPPLQPLAEVAGGYGHANIWEDFDSVFRRQPLVAKSSELVQEYLFEELTPGFTVDEAAFERLVWFDRNGRDHTIATPLTDRTIAELATTLEQNAPRVELDNNNDGEIDGFTFVIRRYQESFIPSITLSLAANYFNKTLEDLEVAIGESIVIHEPEYFNSATGAWEPYRILVQPIQYEYDDEGNILLDADGNAVIERDAVYRTPGEIRIPIDEDGTMLINFMGRRSSPARGGYQTFPVRPYFGYAVGVPGPDPSQWPPTIAAGNKILMVGAFAQGLADDEKLTPYGLMYGVEVHANALNTIIMDNFIIYAPWWVDFAILLVLALVMALVSGRLSTVFALVGSVVMVVVYFFVTNALFEARNLLLNFSSPALAVLLTFVSIVVYRVMTEERDKRRIRDMFGKYVSPAVVTEILESPPELGGVDKDLTVLFSDIRGFTTLSEAMTPQELVNHLNLYLTAMTDIILEYRGTLDKYVGDEIMCFWGAPLPQEDHAILACRGALRQMERLEQLNSEWPAERRINIGIGINSGIMTVGNMGSMGRMNYTLMGDNVNLGARLEGTNKQYGTNVIISENTYGLVKDRVVARELDNIRVKGKNRPVVIYELIDVIDGDGGTSANGAA